MISKNYLFSCLLSLAAGVWDTIVGGSDGFECMVVDSSEPDVEQIFD